MRKISLLSLLTLAVTIVLAPSASANHPWGSYHWAQASQASNPVNVDVPLGDNLTDTAASKWDTLFQIQGVQATLSGPAAGPTVVSAWSNLHETSPAPEWTQLPSNAVDSLETPAVVGRNLSSQKRCKPYSGRIEVCNARYGYNGWLGLAQIWTSGGHIVQGAAKMNDSYFDNTRSFPDSNQIARQHVLCQEVGHGFGLGHQDESGKDFETCMDYDNANSNAQPNGHDSWQIDTIYHSHDDGAASGSTSTKANRGQVRRLGKDLYVEDLGGGDQLFTFVTWIDDHHARSARSDQAPE
ncbi:MAG TPA: hypothetical protein VGR12_01835 [Solirubrobacteraceae bacterium]|nr:hypothetical protein [Solirubrobacteraceae bacterium]